MRALAGGWGASPHGLDAVTWASAGGCAARHRRVAGVARILAVPPGGRRAPLRGAGSSPGRGVRPCRGAAARPWCPPVVAALVAEDPAPSLPVGDGWHLVVPRRIWRRLEPGPSPPTRRQEPGRCREPRPVPTDLLGHGAEQQVAAAAATEGCGGREGEVGRGGGSRGERESVVFFYFTRGNRGSNAERVSNAGRGPRGYAAAGAKGYALKHGSLEAEPFDGAEVR